MSARVPDIIAMQRRFRAELAAGDARARRELAHAYALAWQEVNRALQDLLERMAQARAAGEEVSIIWLAQEQQLRILERVIERELARLSEQATATVIREQEQAVALAREHAARAIEAAIEAVPDPDRRAEIAAHVRQRDIRPEVLANLVGTLRDGSPLRALFDELGERASQDARQALMAGVATGQNPRVIARQMRDAFGGNLMRALTVARTETLRAYRAANQEAYRANSDVLEGWMWLSDLGPRACAACIAMHGTVHPLDEEFGSHPNCRCTAAPVAKGSRLQTQTGEEWFAQQDEATQRRILGDKGFEAYRQGHRLADFVKTSYSQRWGTTRTVRAARDVLALAPQPTQSAMPVRQSVAARLREQVLAMAAQIDKELDDISQRQRRVLDAMNGARGKRLRELSQEYDDLAARAHELRETRRQTLVSLLKVDNPAKIDVRWSATVTSERRPVFEEGVKLFESLVGTGTVDGRWVGIIQLKEPGRDRSFYVNNRVYLRSTAGVSITVHELGHWLEDNDPEVHRKAVEFWERRTAGEPLVKLADVAIQRYGSNPGYSDEEVTRLDKFLEPYMGKEYRNEKGEMIATEIVSMGMELLVKDPERLAREDPEYFDFIVDLLRGL